MEKQIYDLQLVVLGTAHVFTAFINKDMGIVKALTHKETSQTCTWSKELMDSAKIKLELMGVM